uniref:Translationally-controlled tumor protein homolog n=1 Tax=Strigamia maritima TaxID=126957 RepID=T1J715_STRMM
MKIYKDLFTGDEMFTDSYKVHLVDDVLYEVYGKYETRKHGEVILPGANPSAEEADEGTDTATESGVDIVLNQRLVETPCFGDKKSYLLYLKDYMKNVTESLKETSTPEEVDKFKTKMNEVIKKLLARFKEFQFFTGESCDADKGMVALLEYRQVNDEEIPIMIFFKHGLQEEKY